MSKKQYASAEVYERKLHKVMERLGITEYDWNWDRHGGWIQFRYKDQMYMFEHTVEKAKARGVSLSYGSDAFAQIVLALEDLARMVERGIYDLQTWVTGMRYLPPPVEVPSYFRFMGYEELPASTEDVQARFRTLAKKMHPDAGGNPDDFKALKDCAEKAVEHLSLKKGDSR